MRFAGHAAIVSRSCLLVSLLCTLLAGCASMPTHTMKVETPSSRMLGAEVKCDLKPGGAELLVTTSCSTSEPIRYSIWPDPIAAGEAPFAASSVAGGLEAYKPRTIVLPLIGAPAHVPSLLFRLNTRCRDSQRVTQEFRCRV